METARRPFPWKRNLYTLWVIQVISVLGFTFTFPFFPLFMKELGAADPAEAALWTGISSWGMGVAMAFFSPLWGILGDRYGRRRNVIRAMVLGGVILFLIGFSQTTGHLVIGRFLVGATSGIFATVMALVASHTPRRNLPYAMGLLQSALFFSTIVGPLVGGLIFDAYGFRAAFFATGGTVLAASAMVVVLVREDFHRPPGATGSLWVPVMDLWRSSTSRLILPVLVIIVLVHAARLMTTPVLALVVEEVHSGTNPATATGIVLAATGVTSVVSSIGAGWLAGRVGMKPLFVIGCVGAALFHIPLVYADSLLSISLYFALAGLFQGGLSGLASGFIAMAVPPERQGSAMGAAQSAHAVAVALGPLAGGILAHSVGLRSVFVADAVLLAVTGVVAVVYLQRIRTPSESSEVASEREQR